LWTSLTTPFLSAQRLSERTLQLSAFLKAKVTSYSEISISIHISTLRHIHTHICIASYPYTYLHCVISYTYLHCVISYTYLHCVISIHISTLRHIIHISTLRHIIHISTLRHIIHIYTLRHIHTHIYIASYHTHSYIASYPYTCISCVVAQKTNVFVSTAVRFSYVVYVDIPYAFHIRMIEQDNLRQQCQGSYGK
jgi:hypothetical protein